MIRGLESGHRHLQQQRQNQGAAMGRDIAFDTPAGSVGAWRADPVSAPRGGLVVVQEIFGVNTHVRSVADRYAAAGYVALAPAFFDPVERGEIGRASCRERVCQYV